MCDLLRSLNGKLELWRRSCCPALDSFGGRHAIERVIDLDAVQPASVVLKELLFGKALGIEHRTPFFIAEARRSEPNPCHSRIIAQLVHGTPVNIGRYDRSSEKTRNLGRFSTFFEEFFNSARGDHIRCNLL